MNQNQFIFGESLSEELMKRINLREIDKNAREWFHPYYSFLNLCKEIGTSGHDLLKASKKYRESYAISILALSLQESTDRDWWLYIPDNDPPDGYIATFQKEIIKDNTQIKGKIREIEVVEHRSEDKTLLNRLKNKLLDTSYNPDTVLVCLMLVSGIYNFEKLSNDLKKISPKLKHIFLIIHGVQIFSDISNATFFKLTAVQLLPEFASVTFDIRNQYKDFKKKFDIGREYRLIIDNEIHYGTKNLKFKK
ncbi:MAG: hypothetical protein ABIE43_03925 [Patescibacteria group bacterium]